MKKIRKKIRVGISVGDLNGIGMEVIIKTFMDKRMMDFCTPIVFGSGKTAAFHRKALEIQNFSFNVINDFQDVNNNIEFTFSMDYNTDLQKYLYRFNAKVNCIKYLSIVKKYI